MRLLPFFAPVEGSAASAVDALDVVETCLLVTLDKFDGPRLVPLEIGVDLCFAGERSAIAEFGLEGSLPAAFLFSAIMSRSAVRLAVPPAREAPTPPC